jgi:F-type H+-transporting ATPase subunit c
MSERWRRVRIPPGRERKRRFERNLPYLKAQKEQRMDNVGLIGMASIVTAGLTIAIGSIGPALGEGRAVAQGLSAMAQQPDEANRITRTLFVGLAMVESTAIYCFVVTMILIFANPFWDYVIQQAGGAP